MQLLQLLGRVTELTVDRDVVPDLRLENLLYILQLGTVLDNLGCMGIELQRFQELKVRDDNSTDESFIRDDLWLVFL